MTSTIVLDKKLKREMPNTHLRILTTQVLLCLVAASGLAQDFTYVTNNGGITITGYTGTNSTAVIPATMNGMPVTSIGDSAFEGLSKVTGVNVVLDTNAVSETRKPWPNPGLLEWVRAKGLDKFLPVDMHAAAEGGVGWREQPAEFTGPTARQRRS